MNDHNSIYFMDKCNFDITSDFLNLNFEDPNIIPICIDVLGESISHGLVDNKYYLNLCWVGRIEDFKIHILKHTIRNACDFAITNKVRIIFHVVGYGKDIKTLKSQVSENHFFELVFQGAMNLDDLKSFFNKKVDVLFAMGTSALEGGSIGIPTVLLDASYEEVSNGYKFNWLYESDGSNVGQFIGSSYFKNGKHHFSQIMRSVKYDKKGIGTKCKSYVEKITASRMLVKEFLRTLKTLTLNGD